MAAGSAIPAMFRHLPAVRHAAVAGCRTGGARMTAPQSPAKLDVPAESSAPRIVGVQYATSTGSAGCETAEIFIFNPGDTPVAFTGARLEGKTVPGSNREALAASGKFRFDLGGQSVHAPRSAQTSDPRVIWSQFYPSPEIPAGGYGVFQIGFRGMAAHSATYRLTLETAAGDRLAALLPRHFPARRRIMAVTWSPDGSVVNVQYSGGTPPRALLLNGGPASPMKVLEPALKGRPGVVCATMPKPAVPGTAVMVELDFGDGGIHRFLARALLDIVIDAPDGWHDWKTLPEPVRLKYGFDENPAVKRIDIDVACDDTRAGRNGHRAPDVIGARMKAYAQNPARLHGVEFCTAQYPSIRNIYTPIADAVFAKPYQLSLSADPAMFIENEHETLSSIVASSSPRPVIWVPERYRKNRRIEARELEVLSWLSFMRGARGICFHFWKNNPENPFADWHDVAQSLPSLCRDIGGLRRMLVQLSVFSPYAGKSSMTSVHEGWVGDSGVLLLVRNMRYSTDGEPNDGGRKPRFRFTPSANVKIPYAPPPWLQPGDAVDPLTGERIATARAADGKISVSLPRLESFRLVWIPNTDPEALSAPFAPPTDGSATR